MKRIFLILALMLISTSCFAQGRPLDNRPKTGNIYTSVYVNDRNPDDIIRLDLSQAEWEALINFTVEAEIPGYTREYTLGQYGFDLNGQKVDILLPDEYSQVKPNARVTTIRECPDLLHERAEADFRNERLLAGPLQIIIDFCTQKPQGRGKNEENSVHYVDCIPGKSKCPARRKGADST